MKHEYTAKHNRPPYKELVLVCPSSEKERPHFELRIGHSGITLAPKKLNDKEAATELLAFFVNRSKLKEINEKKS